MLRIKLFLRLWKEFTMARVEILDTAQQQALW